MINQLIDKHNVYIKVYTTERQESFEILHLQTTQGNIFLKFCPDYNTGLLSLSFPNCQNM